MTLNTGADAAYDREDRAWFYALPTADLEALWAQVSGPNLLTAAGPWDDEVFDALAERGWFEENGVDAPGGPKDIWTDPRDETGCYCPGDCTCHNPYRLTLCGCTGKHARKELI